MGGHRREFSMHKAGNGVWGLAVRFITLDNGARGFPTSEPSCKIALASFALLPFYQISLLLTFTTYTAVVSDCRSV